MPDWPAFTASASAALLLVVAVLALSPVAILDAEHDDFRGRRSSLTSRHSERSRWFDSRVSRFFFDIAGRAKAGQAIVVWPFDYHWGAWNQLAADQHAHQKRVYVASDRPIFFGDGMSLRNVVRLQDASALVERGVRYLVVDTDRVRRLPEDEIERGLSDLTPRYGPVIYRDDRILVHDLAPR